ncbi:class I SAM-dependent methyltransferase [Azonexus sp.]|uniref:class I SAM-dependent methyltransferase n=1 Tax=Azonexus sp. TaxID=1872668 RepID=UPI0039E25BFC
MSPHPALPIPEAAALAHSQAVFSHLLEKIHAQGGWLPFADFMAELLYAPGLGYYAAGAQKFGTAGDFTTAPEMTPLFAQALAAQVAQIMAASQAQIIEVGAGSGRLAADLLIALEALGCLPQRYAILELSPELQARQRATLTALAPQFLPRIDWLDQLPERFSGVVLANELLDALPVHLVKWQAETIYERGVSLGSDGRFTWNDRPAQGNLRLAAEELAEQHGLASLPDDYLSEIGLQARGWAAAWAERLTQGALLLIDYGFPAHEFYHPQRNTGTLMCHYRHHAHADPFYLPGLQDVTAHVDFTAIIAAAHTSGLELLGYTHQGQFLLNCGILQALSRIPEQTPAYYRAASAVGKLTLPHEMGELFKVVALGRGIDADLLGFTRGDQSHRL